MPELAWLTITFYCGNNSTGNVMVPLNIKDAKPVPPDLEEFVSNSGGHGFIIVSFGSNVASVLPRPVVDMLATAFGKLKQRVVWRLKGISVEPLRSEGRGGVWWRRRRNAFTFPRRLAPNPLPFCHAWIRLVRWSNLVWVKLVNI